MPKEVELKLFAPAGTLGLFREAPIIVRNARNNGTVRRLEAVYYDTTDARLARHGVSFRVRRSGKQHIQTLKTAPEAGSLQRGELEAPVASFTPDLALLPLAEIGAPLEGLSNGDLVPIFTTKVRRHLQTVDFAGAVIEVAFDEGELLAGDRSEAVCEIELELKAGDVGALYELGLALLDVAPLSVGTLSKAERGNRLATSEPPKATKAPASGIVETDTVDETIGKVLTACHRHVMANLVAAQIGADPEGVHQLRVALRRLRSAIWLFRREIPAPSLQALTVDAKRLASALGPARAWDVFLTTTVPELEAGGLPELDFAGIRAASAPFRDESYRAVRAELATPQCARFLLSLGRLIERRSWRNDISSDALAVLTQPASMLADRALARLQRKALKQGHRFRHLQPEARHALRLTLKKLRYAVEFFQPIYAGDARSRKYLRRLSKLQDILGTDNDVTTTRSLLREIEAGSASLEVHRAVGAVMGWQGRDRQEAARSLLQAWRRFLNTSQFWSD